MLIHPLDLRAILLNIQKIITSSLSLPINPDTNIWTFYKFLKIHPLVFSDTLIIFIIVPLIDNTFHIQIYCIHTVPMVNTAQNP